MLHQEICGYVFLVCLSISPKLLYISDTLFFTFKLFSIALSMLILLLLLLVVFRAFFEFWLNFINLHPRLVL